MAGKKGQAPRVEFSHAKFDEICQRVATGDSLRSICARPGMPRRETFDEWRKRSEALQGQYDQACRHREEHYFEQIIAISDRARDPAKARVQIDARKWVLACMNRKKYGDRVTNEHTGEDGGPMQVVHTINLVAMKRDEEPS